MTLTYREFVSRLSEDAPTVSAGGGQIDGIGVGSKGEPGVRLKPPGKRLKTPILKRKP
jgi:hypothetical protein